MAELSVKTTQTRNERSAAERAEDIAYTINHSLYCTLTDFLNPPINAATDNWLRWLIPGCGHDHSGDEGHHHPHGGTCGGHHHHEHQHHHAHDHHHHEGCSHAHPPAQKSRWERVKNAARHAFSKERFIQYAKGEFIGDFGAVPLTIAVQRFFPGFMETLRRWSEPVMRPVFRYGIERDTAKWAQAQGITKDSKEYNEHRDTVYEYEMSHFPQAIVWTGFSLLLNTAYQMFADKSDIPFARKFALKSTSVLSGVVVTAGVVVAARALMPDRMHRFDQWTSRTVILPTTKAVGKVFGVSSEDVDRMAEKDRQIREGTWVNRSAGESESRAL